MSDHGRAIPRALLAPIEREVALLKGIAERSLAPFDAVFELLEQSGAAMHRQADALSESARALEQAAELMRVQADLFELTVRTARPADRDSQGTRGGPPARSVAAPPRVRV